MIGGCRKSRIFYGVNTGSTVICSPGKISANVDIRDTRSWSTNDYSAQSSIVKGTECLLTHNSLRKIECLSWESKIYTFLTLQLEKLMLQRTVKIQYVVTDKNVFLSIFFSFLNRRLNRIRFRFTWPHHAPAVEGDAAILGRIIKSYKCITLLSLDFSQFACTIIIIFVIGSNNIRNCASQCPRGLR